MVFVYVSVKLSKKRKNNSQIKRKNLRKQVVEICFDLIL